MNYGFFKVCTCSPELKVSDTEFNTTEIIKYIKTAEKNNANLIVFPELSITGYTCGDLFFQKTLQNSALKMIEKIADETSSLNILIVVGSIIALDEALYNCGIVIHGGKILSVIPKTFIPNYQEFYEKRYFAPYSEILPKTIYISEKNSDIPFGTDILICDKENSGFNLAVELCEDLWTVNPPSNRAVFEGATVIANLSASNEIIGKAEYRKNLVNMQSARTISAYIYANASHDESTQDLVFSGHNLICENGTILAESKPFSSENLIYSEIDIERILHERQRTTTFNQSKEFYKNNLKNNQSYRKIFIKLKKIDYSKTDFLRKVSKTPFVPENLEKRNERSKEVITLQAEGLRKRLKHINSNCAVIGLSGGLDSTLALLITCEAFDLLKINRKKIVAVTMPCFGTTSRTYNNALLLAKNSGVTLLEVNIKDSVLQHFKDINHDEKIHDITYENCQARERTQVLMDIANKNGGIVIGTGDLSELALGWCTYNADQMSMYGVNSSIPKTLVRYLVNYFAENAEIQNPELCKVLKDILDTPVSPELLPPEDGKISQKTEDLVGPYELHDFFLYYVLRFGFSPKKILFLAEKSNLQYKKEEILKWLKNFYRRFFTQQFKRSCMPDGAKVGTVNLSPRGDWRMPSDASSAIWLQELEGIK